MTAFECLAAVATARAARRAFSAAALIGALSVAGCSVSASVVAYAVEENGEALRLDGEAVGYLDGTGEMTMKAADGTECSGDFSYTNETGGVAMLECSEGESARVAFASITNLSGRGRGASNKGRRIVFAYAPNTPQAEAHLMGMTDLFQPGDDGNTQGNPRSVSGSGFFISSNGHIVTNDHVAGDCEKIEVTDPIGGVRRAELIVTNRKIDVAALKIDVIGRPYLKFRREDPALGEGVVAFGFPRQDLLSEAGVLARGEVNAFGGARGDHLIQTSATIQHGNSGGAAVGLDGAVLGVNASGYTPMDAASRDAQNVNFAVRGVEAAAFLEGSGVPVERVDRGAPKSVEEIAKILQERSVLIECDAR